MATIGFGICLIISVLTLIYMAQKNYDNVQIYYWSILILNPIIILAYWLKTRITTPESARLALCFSNLDGTMISILFVFAMLRGMGIRPKTWKKIVGYGAAFFHSCIIWICFDNNLYYKSVKVVNTGYGYATKVQNGPLKIVHYVYLLFVLLIIFSIFAAGFAKKGTYSRRILIIYSLLAILGFALYGLDKVLSNQFSFLPYYYVVVGILIAIDYDNVHGHDIVGIVSNEYGDDSSRGYVAIGLNKTFLCCNPKGYQFLPYLKLQRVDSVLKDECEEFKIILELIDDFEAGKRSSAEFKCNEMTCVCDISYFSVIKGGKNKGYLLDIRDATEEKRNLQILTNYNEMLNEEVAEKTDHIRNIQRKIVLGMAEMIENRDNSTGGHVKRTSDVIGIIIDEIQKNGELQLSEQLANDIVRAAPMHDLGKMQIDSSILCKPGKLTEEEFAIMKTHSSISGEMVKILLEGVEEEHFVKVSYNLARYHHERWDGKGYPEGLVGSKIPIEARIMAVADVYDALVSERCYKEALSFEKAAEIMCENMGTQFDPTMKEIFVGCRNRLENYYENCGK